MLLEAVYERHLDLYYNKDQKKWNKITDITDHVASSESQQEFETYHSDPGDFTDSILLLFMYAIVRSAYF